MRTLIISVMLVCSLLLVSGCYPAGIGKEVRECKDDKGVIESQLCLSKVAYEVADEHPKAARKICEKEIAGLYDEESPLEDIAGQIMVNGCLQVIKE